MIEIEEDKNARNVSCNPAKACPAWQSWLAGNPGNLAIQQSGNPKSSIIT